MDDLEPPRDDLFAQRALLRGRARTSRRRNGGARRRRGPRRRRRGRRRLGRRAAGRARAPSAAVRPCRSARCDSAAGERRTGLVTDSGGIGAAAPSAPTSPPTGIPTGPPALPSAPPDMPGLGPRRVGVVRRAGDAAAHGLREHRAAPRRRSSPTSSPAPTRAGDGTGRIVVTVTRRDPALEALVTGAMPSPGDVEFATVANSYAAKRAVADQVVADAAQWRAQGVDITGVRIDGPQRPRRRGRGRGADAGRARPPLRRRGSSASRWPPTTASCPTAPTRRRSARLVARLGPGRRRRGWLGWPPWSSRPRRRRR